MEHIINDTRLVDGQMTKIDSKIFLDRHMLDKGTMTQIREIIHHPSVHQSRFMPDCHRGKGCCVGFTSQLNERVVPKYIGGDIGCGILTYPIGSLIDTNDLPDIDLKIRHLVPMGTFTTEKSKPLFDNSIISDQDILWVCEQSYLEGSLFAKMYKNKYNKKLNCPIYDKIWFENLCSKCGIDFDYVLRSIGTLGGGNHFIELNRGSLPNSEQLQDFVTIHCGSRSLGDKVCMYHQNKISDTYHFDYKDFKDKIKNFERKSKVTKERKQYEDSLIKAFKDAKHTDYLEDEEAYEYFFDMIFCQKLAQLNRRLILRRILAVIQIDYDTEKIIESIHNYIDFNDFVLRKGAISAHNNRLCIVSLNMRDGIMLCTGKGNSDWNYSSAHGSGRLYARNEVAHKVKMHQFQESMKDIFSTSVVPETLDECPMAYKDTEIIKQALNNTVAIMSQLRPILNIKAVN